MREIKVTEELLQQAQRHFCSNQFDLAEEQINAFINTISQYSSLRVEDRHRLAEALLLKGQVLRNDCRRTREAIACFRKAIALCPANVDYHCSLSEALLANGEWSEGFCEYEYRFLREDGKEMAAPYVGKKRWTGEIFTGKRLLVYFEQGLGDSIQFCRYIKYVKARGGTVGFFCQSELLTLFRNGLEGVDILTDKIFFSEWDIYVPLLSLPYILGVTPQNVLQKSQYLKSNRQNDEKWREIVRATNIDKVIGIVWSANKYQATASMRSCLLMDMKAVFDLRRVRFVSLQMGEARNEIAALGIDILDLGLKIHDFSDTAAILKNIDLLITVDTSVVHLAGALGIPVWLALPYRAEWRWLSQGDASVWYNNCCLFRQNYPKNWQGVFEKMKEKLISGFLSDNKGEFATLNHELLLKETVRRVEKYWQAKQYEDVLRIIKRSSDCVALRNYFVSWLNDAALSLRNQSNFPMAVKYIDSAIDFLPEEKGLLYNKATILLKSGNLKSGFALYEYRNCEASFNQSATNKMRFDHILKLFKRFPDWNGRNFENKTILVYNEQGLGDALMFMRYLPYLKSIGGTVQVVSQNQLRRLYEWQPWIDSVFTTSDAEFADMTCDFKVSIGSLPYYFKAELNNIPAITPYIFLKNEKNFELPENGAGNMKVGMIWQGHTQRGLTLNHLAVLGQISGIDYYSLQMGNSDKFPDVIKMFDLMYPVGDMADTAQLVKKMDLVITVDTALAHLCGALGIETWVILPVNCEWRWLDEREDSPWYPTVKLFRQTDDNHWEDVMARIGIGLVKRRDSLGCV